VPEYIFIDLIAGAEEARQTGYEPLTASLETLDHKVYYPGAHPIEIRISEDINTEQI
jgi:hypothetical protein